ncbi:MAG: hypothetical protein ACD_29C00076G0003 [uncultured bacterium]|nr:MAG: hypothetical protein ACD_29C00076G0003 [uncultured bacterium]
MAIQTMRSFSLIDKILIQANLALETIFTVSNDSRKNPADTIVTSDNLTVDEQNKSASLMRVNHTGEICAQALYRGQSMCSHSKKTRDMLEKSCDEETDHLAWTKQRLLELNSRTSCLNIFFYCNSYMIGLLAGFAGDQWSLGFVAETEIQVAKHLEKHLKKLPKQDLKSRIILEKMRDEEMQHQKAAFQAGAAELPFVIKKLMRVNSKVMTILTAWI